MHWPPFRCCCGCFNRVTIAVAPETWIELDSKKGFEKYLQGMATEGWAGGIELVGCSLLLHVNLHVYESVEGGGGSIKRIGCFNGAPSAPCTCSTAMAATTTPLMSALRK